MLFPSYYDGESNISISHHYFFTIIYSIRALTFVLKKYSHLQQELRNNKYSAEMNFCEIQKVREKVLLFFSFYAKN
jgi:hypothetical protein